MYVIISGWSVCNSMRASMELHTGFVFGWRILCWIFLLYFVTAKFTAKIHQRICNFYGGLLEDLPQSAETRTDVMPNRVLRNRVSRMFSGNPYEFQNHTRNLPTITQAVRGTYCTTTKVNGHSCVRKRCVYIDDCLPHDFILSILSTLYLQT